MKLFEPLKPGRHLRWFITVLVCAVLSTLVFVSTRPHVIHLGIFAGSNWDVPGSNVYEIIDDAIARFEAENPTIKVVYDSGIRREDYSRWLSDKLLEGDMPDVFMVLGDDLPALANIGALHSLESFAYGTDGLSRDEFYDAAYRNGVYNGNWYALPYESNPQFMFVNLTLLEKEGIEIPDNEWTLSDLYAICEKVTKDTDGDGRLDQFGIYDYSWQDALIAAEVRLFEPGGKHIRLQDMQVQNAISYACSLNEMAGNKVVSQDDFDEGRVAFAPMTYAQYKTYKPYPWKVKKFSPFEWTVIPMPAKTANGNGAVCDSLMIAMASTTKAPKEAWKLMKTLCADEQTTEMMLKYSQGLPSTKNSVQLRKSIENQDDIKQDSRQSAVSEASSLENNGFDDSIADWVMARSNTLEKFPNYAMMVDQIDMRLQAEYADAPDKDLFFMDLQNLMEQALQLNPGVK